MSSASRVEKVTPGAAVQGMQSMLHRLTDVFSQAMSVPIQGDSQTQVESTMMDLVARAAHKLEAEDSDLLSPQQAADLIAILGTKGNEHYLKFYVSLTERVMWRAFVRKLIGLPEPEAQAQPEDVEMTSG